MLSDAIRNKWFKEDAPAVMKMAIAIYAVAHSIHQGDESYLQSIFSGANYKFVKGKLDELAWLELQVEIRKTSRGFFSPILGGNLLPLSKQDQVGMTVKEDITDAVDAYDNLFKAGLASPGEILTLARYSPQNELYQKAVIELGLDKEENEPMVVGGPASVEMVDKEGHLITTEALSKAFSGFMKNIRTANINILHSDVQVGWPLPAYITKQGHVFKSGVDDTGLWLISELRDDIKIAKRVIDEINNGVIKCYSIAGSATKVKNVNKGMNVIKQVDELELAEVTLCERGINQGAHFNILKSDDENQKRMMVFECDTEKAEVPYSICLELNKWFRFPNSSNIVIAREFPDVSLDGGWRSWRSVKRSVDPKYELVDYRPSDKEGEECHLCVHFDSEFCKAIQLPVKPEYVCDLFEAMPEAALAEEHAEEIEKPYEMIEEEGVENKCWDAFNDWMEKNRAFMRHIN